MQVGVPPKPMQGFPSPWQSCGRSELIGTRAKNGVNSDVSMLLGAGEAVAPETNLDASQNLEETGYQAVGSFSVVDNYRL